MKNKTIVSLGIIGALYVGSSVAIHSENTRVQKLAIMGLGTSVLAGIGSMMSLEMEKDNDDDDPRMKDVYDELNTRHPNEDPEPDDIDLDEEENGADFERSIQDFHNNMPLTYPKRQRGGRM